jgi:hypothetical protein
MVNQLIEHVTTDRHRRLQVVDPLWTRQRKPTTSLARRSSGKREGRRTFASSGAERFGGSV